VMTITEWSNWDTSSDERVLLPLAKPQSQIPVPY